VPLYLSILDAGAMLQNISILLLVYSETALVRRMRQNSEVIRDEDS
jgi:hypothetical protein